MKEIYSNIECYKVLSQEADCCADDTPDQEIEIKTQNGGSGDFITISTKRWAVDDRNEWMKLWDEYIQPMLDLADKHNKEYQSVNDLPKEEENDPIYEDYKNTPISQLSYWEYKGSKDKNKNPHFTREEFYDWCKKQPNFAKKWNV